MRSEFLILANGSETQRSSATLSDRTPEGKRHEQMVQVNAGNSIILSRIFAPRKGDCDSIDKQHGRWYNEGGGADDAEGRKQRSH